MRAWTDEQLVKACLEGNEQAWSALVDKYKNLIYSIPIKYGISREDAGDIFQQVWLGLLSELPSIRDPQCLGAWLIRVTSHKCFHWGRREGRMKKLASAVEAGAEATAVEEAPDENLLQAEREQILREAMMQISPRCRELLEMLFYRNPPLPYDEVARAMGLARGSIGFTRMRCLKQLRSRLKDRGFR